MQIFVLKPGQEVRVGETVITALGHKGKSIRVGVEAPPAVAVERSQPVPILTPPDRKQ